MKWLILILTLCLILFVGCGRNGSGNHDALIPLSTVTIMSTVGSNAAGHGDAEWYAAIVREQLGIELDFMHTAGVYMGQLVNALLASGDLPDILVLGGLATTNNAAATGLLLNLDDYQNQLPNIFLNPMFDAPLLFYRENASGGREGLFAVPSSIGETNSLNYNIHLRWDIYQMIGAPPIHTLEDYLPVLRQMMDAYPVTEAGQPVWGISLFSDWDGFAMNMAHWIVSFNYGVDGEYVSTLLETPVDGSGLPVSILCDYSYYKRALQFFFDANQMGVLDPDSITQNWDTLQGKFNEGRVLMSPWQWAILGFNILENTDAVDFRGYAPVWADDFTSMIFPDNPVGRDWAMSVSRNARDLDAALRYMNWYFSFEATDLLMNGPQGVLWDIDQTGLRYRTAEGWRIIRDDAEMPGGGRLRRAFHALNILAFSAEVINPAAPGQPLGSDYWESTMAFQPTRLEADWRNHNDGYLNMLERGASTGQTIKGHAALNMMPSMPHDMYMLAVRIGEVIRTHSWQMVYADNQESFDAMWRYMQDTAFAMGKQRIIDWTIYEFENALVNTGRFWVMP